MRRSRSPQRSSAARWPPAREAVNVSPEPFSNWALSLSEDLAVPLALWLAFAKPLVLIGLVVLFFVAAAFAARWLWRAVRRRSQTNGFSRSPPAGP